MSTALGVRRTTGSHRRLAMLITLVFLAACSTSTSVHNAVSNTPGASTATSVGSTPPATSNTTTSNTTASDTSATTSPLPDVPDPLGLVPADLFTAPPNPLTLTIMTADDHAAAVAIGPDGGTISTTGADGTVYTMTIPAKSLPLPITITMTPIASEAGFPADGTPQHTLGVAFAPDGLTLAQTATLAITPATPIDGPMAVLDAEGSGSDVGFHSFDHDAAGVQIPIDHFSSYTAEYPVDLPQIRAQALFLQAELEKRLASETAEIVGFQRQAQLYPGLPSFGTPLTLAKRILAEFKNTVLARRLALAPRGCQESEEAMAAFAAYERSRELLGVGDDPEFGLVGVTFLVPPTLVDLAIRLCFREAFKFCVKTGTGG